MSLRGRNYERFGAGFAESEKSGRNVRDLRGQRKNRTKPLVPPARPPRNSSAATPVNCLPADDDLGVHKTGETATTTQRPTTKSHIIRPSVHEDPAPDDIQSIVPTSAPEEDDNDGDDSQIPRPPAPTTVAPEPVSPTDPITTVPSNGGSATTWQPLHPHPHNPSMVPDRKETLPPEPTKPPNFPSHRPTGKPHGMLACSTISCRLEHYIEQHVITFVLLFFCLASWCCYKFNGSAATSAADRHRGEYQVLQYNDGVFGEDYSDNELSDDEEDMTWANGGVRSIEMKEIGDRNGLSLEEMNG